MFLTLKLHNLVPDIFREQQQESDVWGQDVCFESGKSYLIESASGGGKSSLLSFIYGYRNDYQGDVLIDGKNVSLLSQNEKQLLRRQVLSVMFQELRLFPMLTAYENVVINNRLMHFRTEEEINRWFGQFGLIDKLNVPVRLLSWGQRQRVAFIRALCQPCSFLLLDEPVSHLDDSNTHIMADILKEEQNARSIGIIATSIGRHLPLDYAETLRL
ncbi:MAG: ATP-binding cassette domain-containing protein [Paludibacteraceae bacterium]|nr:ATP-binding cassette domain-containing protein [Paludibacteraceae bacterium]